MAITSFEQLRQPLPLPYDEHANADRVVASVTAQARKDGKLVLLDLGGNWCPDCRVLAGTMQTEPLKSWAERHFDVAMVDVGRFDKNLQVPARYGIKGRLAGVPALFIVDPKTGRVLNRGHETALADASSMTPQALADWLARWVS